MVPEALCDFLVVCVLDAQSGALVDGVGRSPGFHTVDNAHGLCITTSFTAFCNALYLKYHDTSLSNDCALHISAYSPPLATNSACVPSSATFPPKKTKMRPASFIVLSR